MSEMEWPTKTREMHNHHMDSTRWNDFQFRDGDIVIATWAKAGTTWAQQIVSQLVFGGAEGIPVFDISPWVDMRLIPREEVLGLLESQQHRRILKTHLPVDALVMSQRARYLYLARDGRDVVWSFYHHHSSMTEQFFDALNGIPGLVGPPLGPPTTDVVQYFHDWLDRDGYPCWPFWSHVQSWWDLRNLPNVMLVHFNDLKRDMPAEIRRIAAFLDIPIDESRFPDIVEHCTFDYMKANAEKLSQMLDDTMFEGGMPNFINKGTNARWSDMLSAEDIEKYERAAAANLTPECADWLANGRSEAA